MKVTIDGMDQYKQVLLLLHAVYIHPDTTQAVKDMLRLELGRIYGSEYDIKKLLNKGAG